MPVEIHPEYRGNLVSEVENFLRLEADQSIPQRLRATVAQHPEGTAMEAGQERISFAELDRLSNRVGRALVESFRGEKDTVGLLFGHTPASVTGMYGALKAGKICVPLDRDYPLSNLEHMVRDSGLKVILTEAENLALAEKLLPQGGLAIDTGALDSQGPENSLGLDVPGKAIAAIYYSSGSTGKPKGIIKLHSALQHRPYGFGPGDRQAHLTSFAVSAAASTIFSALLSGATICFYAVRELGLGGLADWLDDSRINVFYPPVSLFHEFVDILKESDFFPHLRLVQLAGQRVNASYVEKFRPHLPPECLIKHLLASSEAGASTAYFITPETVIAEEGLPVGFPTIDKRVSIVNEDGKELEVGQVGEIVVRGRNVAVGYWGEAAAEQEKFVQAEGSSGERIVFTGDIGLLNADGMLEYRGRRDEMVKISGYRVELPLVEASLMKLPGVQEAAVAAKETASGNRRLIAYLAPQEARQSGVSEIRKELSNDLPWFMLPSQFIILERLPRTPNGKIDRPALPEPDQANIARDAPYAAPGSDLEAQIVKIWENVLGIQPVGVQDDFFSIGGDSLRAMRIFVEIERLVGKKLPLSLLFKASTAAEQAGLLQEKDWVADWDTLVAVQPEGSAPPLLCLPGVGGNVLNFHDLSNYLGPDQPVYALQSKGIGGQEDPLTNIDDIARFHIQSIRQVQPHGPYYLCGSSFGGKAAYEIAQQLHDLGEQVNLVAMFDTYGPDYPKRIPGMNKRKVWLRRRAQKLRKHLRNLGDLDLKGKLGYLRMRLPGSFKRLRVRLSDLYQSLRYPLPKDLKRVRKANKIANRYMPSPPRFNGRLVLFRASHRAYGLVPDPLIGWGAVAEDRIEVIEVEGHHDTLLWEPQVGNTARLLKQLLDETRPVEENARPDEVDLQESTLG